MSRVGGGGGVIPFANLIFFSIPFSNSIFAIITFPFLVFFLPHNTPAKVANFKPGCLKYFFSG